MITIEEYVKPWSVAEAYTLLTTGKNTTVVGGGAFMRLASRKVRTAVDLSRAGLNFIRETGDTIEIGAMTTFRELEQSLPLRSNFDGLIPRTVRNVGGVQLRNMVTVGGTVYGRYGFSELLTGLMVLDVQVVLHKNGMIALPEFFVKGNPSDILEKVIIAKQELRGSYQVFRNTSGSLPILCVAASKANGAYKIAVGGRPGLATYPREAMTFLNSSREKDELTKAQAADIAAAELEFGSDRKATAAYRRELCKALVKRAVMEVEQ
jgi:CO/xanthine dehydrogenase FAD-binding subunit